MRAGRIIAGVVAGVYLVVVAGALAWAYANERDASLGFMVPYFATFPVSAGLVQVLPLPGYVVLAVAGAVQAAIIYAVICVIGRAAGRLAGPGGGSRK